MRSHDRFRQRDPLSMPWREDRQFARKCGDCRFCCTAQPIQTPELDKPAGTPCPHLVEHGCGVFGTDDRPGICSLFACNWLRGDGSVHQRPDRMGAMPVLAPGGRHCELYLAPGLTPETLTREARAYVRMWHRKRKTPVGLFHGPNYETTTALFPNGQSVTGPTQWYDGENEPSAAAAPPQQQDEAGEDAGE